MRAYFTLFQFEDLAINDGVSALLCEQYNEPFCLYIKVVDSIKQTNLYNFIEVVSCYQLITKLTKKQKLLMKGLHSTKTILSITDKKSATRIARHLPSLNNNELSFDKITCMIIPVYIFLPRVIIYRQIQKQNSKIAQKLKYHQVTKQSQQNKEAIPVNIQRQKWIRISFGQQCKKLILRLMSSVKRIDKMQVFTDIQSWKHQQKQQALNSYHISMQSILLLLKSKIEKQQKKPDIHYKNSISSFMKSKFSERGNLKSHNAIIKRSEHVVLGRQQEQKKQASTIAASRTRKRDSQTLQLQNLLEQEKFKDRRDSNASTSIRIQSRDIKFSKRIKKLRELADTKNSYSQKQTLLDDTSEFFPSTKIRPRFYQHINLSQQQIDLKRRKFDSQFITKKSAIPATNIQIEDKQGNESQVTEDIAKMQGSKSIHPMQDTLERGLQQNQQNNAQQSGTLCQSVYQ